MLNDEEIISVKRVKDCYLKLIEIVRLTYNKSDNVNEVYKVFRDIHKINNYDEKMLYLLCVYIVNSKDDTIEILNYTDISSNHVISDALINGIKLNEINSSVLKDYLESNGIVGISIIDIISLIESLDKRNNTVNNEIISKNTIDFNINHLEKENIKLVEDRNNNLKRKIRRKILYDKYQRRY